MKKNLARILLLLLALATVLSAAVACAKDPANPPDKDPSGDNDPSKPEDDEKPRVDHGVPVQNFDYDIKCLHYHVEGWIPWDEIVSEYGYDGDLISHDIANRANWLEETYGIRLANEYMAHDKLPQAVENNDASGDDEWQLFDQFGFGLGQVFGKYYFLNMAEQKYIDFSHPWWVKSSVENLSIGSFVEFAASDLLLLDKGATACVFYNIPMSVDLGIDNLYQEVDNKSWTMERMAEYAQLALKDDGNDQWDENDIYGVMCGDDPVHHLYIGSGRLFETKDEDGYFRYEYGSGDTIEVMMDIFDSMMYQDFFYNTWHNRQKDNVPSFKDGRSLFAFGKVKECVELRNMTDDYGFLPVPMYDDTQDTYYSLVSNYGDSLLAIPRNTARPDVVGAALELMGWYSYYNIYSDFYDVVICGRGTRDAESVQMLNIIFSNRIYDIGLIKDDIKFTDKVLRYTDTGNTNLSSHFKSFESQITQMVSKMNELVDNY